MSTYNMHEAKSQLSKLVEAALQGEEIVIARSGKPLVRLVPLNHSADKRQPGALRDKLHLSDTYGVAPVSPFGRGDST